VEEASCLTDEMSCWDSFDVQNSKDSLAKVAAAQAGKTSLAGQLVQKQKFGPLLAQLKRRHTSRTDKQQTEHEYV
jgi:hypothetical protein